MVVSTITVSDLIRNAEKLAKRRESICKKNPMCPECRTYQVQVIDVITQEWKCRHCKKVFFTSYKNL